MPDRRKLSVRRLLVGTVAISGVLLVAAAIGPAAFHNTRFVGHAVFGAFLACAVAATVLLRGRLAFPAPTPHSTARHRSETLLRRLEAVQSVTRAMSEQRDIPSVIAAAFAPLHAEAVIDAWAGALFRDDEFEIIAFGSDDDDRTVQIPADGHRVAITPGPIDTIRSTQTSVVVDSPAEIPAELAQLVGGAGLQSIVFVPLLTTYALFGFLAIAGKNRYAIQPEDVRFFEHLGVQIGTAVYQHTLLQDETSRMAAGVVHDVNNALSPIIVYTDLLLRMPDLHAERARKYMSTMQAAARDIGGIVDRLRQCYRGGDADE